MKFHFLVFFFYYSRKKSKNYLFIKMIVFFTKIRYPILYMTTEVKVHLYARNTNLNRKCGGKECRNKKFDFFLKQNGEKVFSYSNVL